MKDNTNKEIEDRWNDFCENQVWGCDGSTLIVIGDFWKNEVTKSHQSGIEEGKRQERERILGLEVMESPYPYQMGIMGPPNLKDLLVELHRDQLRQDIREALEEEK